MTERDEREAVRGGETPAERPPEAEKRWQPIDPPQDEPPIAAEPAPAAAPLPAEPAADEANAGTEAEQAPMTAEAGAETEKTPETAGAEAETAKEAEDGGWFARHFRLLALVFAALMLAACAYIGWAMIDGNAAQLRIEDARRQVAFDWARAERQQAELDQATAVIPEIRGRVDALAEQIAAAEETYDQLKAQRDEARSGYRNIRGAAEAALAEAREAETALAEVRRAYNEMLTRIGLMDGEVTAP